ncbi:MAG: galactose-1-phosphate uridylyltransferase [Acidimicrobiia bacterium]|nr:galactose-1-phosphate uridylyltransferase [Acidimicrobiia bacterium]
MSAVRPVTLARHDLVHPDGRAFHLYGHIADETVGELARQPADNGHDPSHLHRRFDRLTATWVLVSPTRNVRPSAAVNGEQAPSCPLCPGGGELPGMFDVAVFDNRFPSLSPFAPDVSGALVASSHGRCEVVVYTPEHVVGIGDLSPQQFADVIAVWRDRAAALWAEGHAYVMAFENHGNDVGATLAHLHGQIYALDHLPPVIENKLAAHRDHRRTDGTCLGCTLVLDDGVSGRVIHDTEHFVTAVPFAARWPLEVHVRAKHHGVGRLADLDDAAALDLVQSLSEVVRSYDAMWDFALPYLMCVQEAPAAGHGQVEDWHLHVELLPPHRNAARLKVRASVETALGVFINDTVPEDIATTLAAVEAPALDWSGVRMRTITGPA